MVSCGSCNRWQHIACHDLMDQRSGRPKRDWERQQFFCVRCRQRAVNGGVHGGHRSQGLPTRQYSWQDTQGPIPLQKPGGMDPYAHADPRYGVRSPVENGLGGYQQQQQQYAPSSSPAVPYARTYPNSGLPFNHYQPDQRGLSSRLPPITPQGSWSSSSNGYSAGQDPLSGLMPSSSHFTSQYQQNGGLYPSSRMASSYQVWRL